MRNCVCIFTFASITFGFGKKTARESDRVDRSVDSVILKAE